MNLLGQDWIHEPPSHLRCPLRAASLQWSAHILSTTYLGPNTHRLQVFQPRFDSSSHSTNMSSRTDFSCVIDLGACVQIIMRSSRSWIFIRLRLLLLIKFIKLNHAPFRTRGIHCEIQLQFDQELGCFPNFWRVECTLPALIIIERGWQPVHKDHCSTRFSLKSEQKIATKRACEDHSKMARQWL